MPKTAGNDSSPVYVKELAIAGASGSANVFTSLANPAQETIWVLRAWLRTTVVATAAATLDIGIAADSTTASDVLFDGLDVNTAIGIFDSHNDTDNGTNGVAKPQLMTASQYVTVKEASGNVDGLVGTLYIEYTYA